MKFQDVLDALDMSRVSLVWALVTGGLPGLGKYGCKKLSKLLQKIPKEQWATYAEFVTNLGKFINYGVDLFLKKDSDKVFGIILSNIFTNIGLRLSDQTITPDEIIATRDEAIGVIVAWKDHRAQVKLEMKEAA